MSTLSKASIKERMEVRERLIKSGRSARGKAEYIKFLNGEHLSFKNLCLANCYFCMNEYVDGKSDCGCTLCPLYTYMPYADK